MGVPVEPLVHPQAMAVLGQGSLRHDSPLENDEEAGDPAEAAGDDAAASAVAVNEDGDIASDRDNRVSPDHLRCANASKIHFITSQVHFPEARRTYLKRCFDDMISDVRVGSGLKAWAWVGSARAWA